MRRDRARPARARRHHDPQRRARRARRREREGSRSCRRRSDETIEGSDLLVATGRRPNIEGLDLAAAGIRYGAGGIMVDKGLRTINRRVYAIGDVAGGPQFTHAANYHAGLVHPERAVPAAGQGERRERSRA